LVVFSTIAAEVVEPSRLYVLINRTHWTYETAAVYCHRFFAVRSIAKNDRFLVASASIFLACKVEESPRNLRDVAYVSAKLRNANKPQEIAKLNAHTDTYLEPLMDQVLLAERALLYTLNFDLNVDHPFAHFMKVVQKLGLSNEKSFLQLTTNMLNDSLSTTLSLQYDAAVIAHAATHKMASMCKVHLPLPDGLNLCDLFGIGIEDAHLEGKSACFVHRRCSRGARTSCKQGSCPLFTDVIEQLMSPYKVDKPAAPQHVQAQSHLPPPSRVGVSGLNADTIARAPVHTTTAPTPATKNVQGEAEEGEVAPALQADAGLDGARESGKPCTSMGKLEDSAHENSPGIDGAPGSAHRNNHHEEVMQPTPVCQPAASAAPVSRKRDAPESGHDDDSGATRQRVHE